MEKYTSIQLKSQLPEYIREDSSYSKFITFLESYYDWFDDNYKFLEFDKNIDIDLSMDVFITNLSKDFLPQFPSDIVTDKVKLLKIAKQFFGAKGTPDSFKFLFRALFESEIAITYTNDFILKSSGGIWIAPKSIKIKSTATEYLNINNYKVFGVTSKTFGIIDYSILENKFIRIYLSDIKRLFLSGEDVIILDNRNIPVYSLNGDLVSYSENPPVGAVQLKSKIVGALSSIAINPKFRGSYYNVGDPVVITGGLLQDIANPIGATAEVTEVTSGGIYDVEVTSYGYGYSLYPNSLMIVYSGDTLMDMADIRVTLLDEQNPIEVTMCSTLVGFVANSGITIGNTNYNILVANTYGIANTSCNANTSLVTTLNYITQNTYPMVQATVIDGASGFTKPPTITVESTIDVLDNKISLLSLGMLAPIQIANSGFGYTNTDIITIAHGYGGEGAYAKINEVDINGSITEVIYITNDNFKYPLGGMGYSLSSLPPITVTSANGSGAILYVDQILSSGAEFNISTYKIGEISKITLIDEGEDYKSTPNVSLRILDVATSNITSELELSYPDTWVYQGADYDTSTFKAKVFSTLLLEEALTQANNIYSLRVYDFTGIINSSLDLNYYNTNFTEILRTYKINNTYSDGIYVAANNGIIQYGNSLAKADAKFLSGIIVDEGTYFNNRSLLSESATLQSDVYNDKTYILSTEQSYDEFKQSLSSLVHPVGTQVINKNIAKSNTTAPKVYTSNVSVETIVTGTYNLIGGASGYSNTVYVSNVSSTTFNSLFIANNIISINTNTCFVHSTIKSANNISNTIILTDYSFVGVSNVAISNTNSFISNYV